MNTALRKSVEILKKKQIHPDPRWKYLLKKYAAWLIFFLVSSLAAASIAVSYFLIANLDWDAYQFIGQNSLRYILSLIPFFWLGIMLVFLIVAFMNIRQTETGYRFSWQKIFIYISGIIFVFTLTFSFLKFGQIINTALLKNINGYGSLITTKEAQWSQPEKGLLAGTIESYDSARIELKDLQGAKWQLSINDTTLIRPAVTIAQGNMIKAIGEKTSANTFSVKEIRPWQGRQGCNGNCTEDTNAKPENHEQRHEYRKNENK
jgi:hypothetical protein